MIYKLAKVLQTKLKRPGLGMLVTWSGETSGGGSPYRAPELRGPSRGGGAYASVVSLPLDMVYDMPALRKLLLRDLKSLRVGEHEMSKAKFAKHLTAMKKDLKHFKKLHARVEHESLDWLAEANITEHAINRFNFLLKTLGPGYTVTIRKVTLSDQHYVKIN